jgi:hypothetical protein
MDFLMREISDERPEKEEIVQQNGAGCRLPGMVETEPDLPPEYCRYRDEGCEYAASCLACPFPQCLYDEPRGKQRWLKGMRNRQINKLFCDGWDVPELAMLFGVSQRTIQRAVRENSQ